MGHSLRVKATAVLLGLVLLPPAMSARRKLPPQDSETSMAQALRLDADIAYEMAMRRSIYGDPSAGAINSSGEIAQIRTILNDEHPHKAFLDACNSGAGVPVREPSGATAGMPVLVRVEEDGTVLKTPLGGVEESRFPLGAASRKDACSALADRVFKKKNNTADKAAAQR